MTRHAAFSLVTLLLVGCTAAPAPDVADEPAANDETAQETTPPSRIDVALSAAPEAISAQATIMDFDESGSLVELRPGTNGWLCLPDDNPAAPGDAPICVDEAWQAFFGAYMEQTEPEITGVGMSYMLQGGSAASNTDPFAQAPPEGEEWMWDGPHLMVITPDPTMLDAFPTDPANGGPYVMWKGTPYAHLMVPVEG